MRKELVQYVQENVKQTELFTTTVLSQKEYLENMWKSLRSVSKSSNVNVVRLQRSSLTKLKKELEAHEVARKRPSPRRSLDPEGISLLMKKCAVIIV